VKKLDRKDDDSSRRGVFSFRGPVAACRCCRFFSATPEPPPCRAISNSSRTSTGGAGQEASQGVPGTPPSSHRTCSRGRGHQNSDPKECGNLAPLSPPPSPPRISLLQRNGATSLDDLFASFSDLRMSACASPPPPSYWCVFSHRWDLGWDLPPPFSINNSHIPLSLSLSLSPLEAQR
jgi:hypothetical protein